MTLNDINFIVSFTLERYAPSLVVTPYKLGQLLHVAQLKHFKRKLGLPEDAQKVQQYEISKVISSDLDPFKVIMGDKTMEMRVVDGYAPLPSGFYYPSTMRYRRVKLGKETWKEVDILSDKEFDHRVSSTLLRPSTRYPIANLQKNYFRVEPRGIRSVYFVYLKLPTKPVFGITMVRGFSEYDPTTSTELEWNDVNIIDIIYIMLSDLGVKISSAELFQIAEKTKIKGI